MIATFPDPWADPKSRPTLGFHNLYHMNIKAKNWGFYCWILPGVWVTSQMHRDKMGPHTISSCSPNRVYDMAVSVYRGSFLWVSF